MSTSYKQSSGAWMLKLVYFKYIILLGPGNTYNLSRAAMYITNGCSSEWNAGIFNIQLYDVEYDVHSKHILAMPRTERDW